MVHLHRTYRLSNAIDASTLLDIQYVRLPTISMRPRDVTRDNRMPFFNFLMPQTEDEPYLKNCIRRSKAELFVYNVKNVLTLKLRG